MKIVCIALFSKLISLYMLIFWSLVYCCHMILSLFSSTNNNQDYNRHFCYFEILAS